MDILQQRRIWIDSILEDLDMLKNKSHETNGLLIRPHKLCNNEKTKPDDSVEYVRSLRFGSSHYVSPKFAVEGSMSYELEPLVSGSILIELGVIETSFTDPVTWQKKSSEIPASTHLGRAWKVINCLKREESP